MPELLRSSSRRPPASPPPRPHPLARPALARREECRRLRRTLARSSAEGMAAELVGACAGSAALTAWALALGSGPVVIGLLGALPFFSQLVHLPSAWATARWGRRRTALIAVAASRQALLLLAPLPWLPVSLAGKRALFLAVAGISATLAVMGNNAWTSWMGDLVPARLRGRYFARRTALCTLAGMAACLAAGVALDRSGKVMPSAGTLSLLAVLASGAGLLTTWLMSRQHDPGREGEARRPDLQALHGPFRDPAARSSLAYIAAWNGAVGISGTFFAVHLLANVKLGYALLALHGAGAATARVLSVPFWGRALDRAGARPVLAACSFGLALAPLIWILPTASCPWPLAFDAALSGTLLAGHGLASFALPLAVTSRRERPFTVAAFSATGGLAYALASIAGGVLASLLPARFEVWGRPAHALYLLFLVSALGRMGSGFLALRIREPGARSIRVLHSVAKGAVDDLRGRLTDLLG